MRLFSSPEPEPLEDHGDGLLVEFEELVGNLRERTINRHDVVKSRLAALEQESDTLTDLHGRLKSSDPKPH